VRVLLVEDDAMAAESLGLELSTAGLNLTVANFGEEAIDLAKAYEYDVILLDLDLPDVSGMDVLLSLRNSKNSTPIMILSGSSESDTKVRSFTGGADDYVTKPYDKHELVARIRAVVRRSQGHAQSVIRTGDISVNPSTKTVDVNSAPLHRTTQEPEILELHSLRKGLKPTKEAFLSHLYGGLDEPEGKIIGVSLAGRGACGPVPRRFRCTAGHRRWWRVSCAACIQRRLAA
jgi:two-component system cell cycle response regulator CtrA